MKRLFWTAEANPKRSRWFYAGICLLVVPVLAAVLNSCATPVTAKQTAQVYYDLGNAYTQLGEQSKATAAYLNALKLDSTLLKASYNLARVYIEAGDFSNAFTVLNNLLKKDPENLTVLDTLGYAYYRKGDKEHALSYYDQVLTLSPANENALYNRATILSEEGKTEEAISTFRKLYNLKSNPSLLLILGKLEMAVDATTEAVHFLEAYRAAKPDDFEGLELLANAYRQEQLYDKALNTYDAALKVKPDASGVLFAKAEILLTAIQDQVNGLKALKAAVDAGFDKRKEIDALLANKELVGKREVEAILQSKNLLGGHAPAETPPKASSKG